MQRWSSWTVQRHDELGQYTVAVLTPCGERIALEFFDGGGFVAGLGGWRVAGVAVAVIEAAVG